MRPRDFLRMSPRAFSAACKAHADRESARDRSEWERMRMFACIMIQPHVKGRMTPKKLLPFPWEDEQPKGKRPMAKKERRPR